MDNELLFEYMTKMYSEMQDGFKKMDVGFKKNDERFDSIEKRLIVIENDHGSKLNALLDGYKQLSEGQEEIKEDIQALSDKQEKQELEIHVIKGIAK